MISAFLEISLGLVLLIANGVFAMTEIAIASSRKGLLQSMADKGSKGAARALGLSENPCEAPASNAGASHRGQNVHPANGRCQKISWQGRPDCYARYE